MPLATSVRAPVNPATSIASLPPSPQVASTAYCTGFRASATRPFSATVTWVNESLPTRTHVRLDGWKIAVQVRLRSRAASTRCCGWILVSFQCHRSYTALSTIESAGIVSMGTGARANCRADPSRVKSSRPRSATSTSGPTEPAATTRSAGGGPFAPFGTVSDAWYSEYLGCAALWSVASETNATCEPRRSIASER